MSVRDVSQSTVSALTRASPLWVRWLAYFNERFPILAHGVLIASFYSSNQFLAHALTQPGTPMRWDWTSLAGYLTLLCFFLHLRVFDDCKDYQDDCDNFPERILQRGVIGLNELGWLGVVAIVAEFLLAGARGPGASIALVAAFAYSLLMFKEFFAGHWLKGHFLIYASSHMLIMPLLAVVVFSFATGQYPWQAPLWFWLYSFVGFFVGFNWEISRKIRAPGDERQGIDSYTKIFGSYGAAYVVLLVRVIDSCLVALVGYHLGLSRWFYVAIILLFVVCLIGFFDFRLRTSTETARRMELYAAIYIVAFDLTLAVEIARRYGLEFGRHP
jgi:4-hydroxybenzoate polyprenyltransferase